MTAREDFIICASILTEFNLISKVFDHNGGIIAGVNEVDEVDVFPLNKLDEEMGWCKYLWK